jgi:transcription elongation factor Elf1
MAERVRLLPCPFCGAQDPSYVQQDIGTGVLRCAQCTVRLIASTRAEAEALWNTRVPVRPNTH